MKDKDDQYLKKEFRHSDQMADCDYEGGNRDRLISINDIESVQVDQRNQDYDPLMAFTQLKQKQSMSINAENMMFLWARSVSYVTLANHTVTKVENEQKKSLKTLKRQNSLHAQKTQDLDVSNDAGAIKRKHTTVDRAPKLSLAGDKEPDQDASKAVSTEPNSQKDILDIDDQIEQKGSQWDHVPKGYRPIFVQLTLYCVFFVNLFMNIDMGILAAGTQSIKDDIGLNNSGYGTLGSVVYFGQVIGCICSAVLLSKGNIKCILIVCLIMNIFALLSFTQSNNYWVLVASRTFTGVFQIVFAIFMPVWASSFGNPQQQALWMTYLMITSPLGVIMGYLINGFTYQSLGWRWSFFIQSLLMVPSFIGLVLLPSKYFDVIAFTKAQEKINKEKNSAVKKKLENLSQSIRESAKTEKQSSFCKQFGKLLCNIPFIMIVLANTFIFFILTGIQYWVTNYLVTELGEDETTVYSTFGVVSVTGPVLGVVIGGNVTSYLGGFRAKKALQMTIIIAILCCSSAVPVPFMNTFWGFIGLLWFLLFFGGYMMPSLSGMMLETIDADFKTTGNSVANLCYNLLGFLPAPSVYGLVYDYGKGGNARYAMGTLMFTPILSLVCILIAASLIFKNDTFGYKKREAGHPFVNDDDKDEPQRKFTVNE